MTNLPEIETEIFNKWNKDNIFESTLEFSKNRPIFNFYDGPPFATGSPHYGHLLAATIKDTVCRFQTINGFYVPRLNGWDTHGLPIEQLGEKTLGIKTVDDINAMGIDKFNQTCQSLVLSCVKEWEEIIPRMGRWVDFKNGYKTMDFEFMNAVWGVFKAIFDKGLVYRSLTPMPYSTGCGSCLSHFEAKSNYQDTQDPSIVIKFRLSDKQSNIANYSDFLEASLNQPIYFLVWTTTPYSLTGNLALCVNKKIKYCLAKTTKTNEYVILAQELIKNWEQKDNKMTIVKDFGGSDLVGIEYLPPFDFNNLLKKTDTENVIFTVREDAYVKLDSGTGIVHLAPGMGEDDFRVCLQSRIIDIKNPASIPCPIDDKGNLTVDTYQGQYVKQADKNIIKDLKNNGLLWEAKTLTHSYPFCYRTDTPLIQKSISAWFIDVHTINNKIIELNKTINWIPSNVGDARFAQWLSTPRDWSFGRNRFWGTTVPLWVNSDFTEIICVGSTNELEELAGLAKGSITNIHREFIDNIKIPSKQNPGTFLHRINDVFDCWFESGSMPYGKYAVEKKFVGNEIYQILTNQNPELRNEFLKYFPANFIGEGLDQTRGWFYTLLVLSTILFEETAYKNVIVNGLILSADPTQTGKWIKMSKRYKNYPNPQEVLVKYGADALRLYLLDSPVTHSEPLKFQEDGIQQKAKFLVQLFNCFQFLDSEIKLLIHKKNENFQIVESTQIYDKWILGKLKEVMDNSFKHYSDFKLYLVVPLLVEFEELFSKWYINLSKNNMKGFNGDDIQKQSLSTLWTLLYNFALIMSPITPFMSDKLYTGLNELINKEGLPSIHMESLSDYIGNLKSDSEITRKINSMVDVVISVRGLKAEACIGTRMKSKELILKHPSQEFLDDIKELETELLTAIRVDKITYQILGVDDLTVKINPNHTIGKTCKRDLMTVLDIIKKTPVSELLDKTENKNKNKESIIIMGYTIPGDTWIIIPREQDKEEKESILVDYTNQGLLVQLTKEVITTPLEDQMELMIKNMQKAKKEANLKPYQIADIYLEINTETEFYRLINEEFDNIKERLRSNLYLNQTNKHMKLDEFTKVIQNVKTELYSYEIWI
jgi:isoleucyl-tRNA synthetase